MKKKTITEVDVSRFHGDLELGEKRKMVGTYDLGGGIVANYSVTQQKPTAHWLARGSVSLVDPRTGSVMKVRKRKRKGKEPLAADAEKPEEETGLGIDEGSAEKKKVFEDARISVNMNSLEPEAIRSEIAKKAKKLYNRNILQIRDSAEKAVPIADMSFALAVKVYEQSYLHRKVFSDDRRHTYQLFLAKNCECLPNKAIASISLNDVKEACRKIGDNWREYIKEAEKFLDYIFAMKRNSDCKNVFTEYLSRNPTEDKKAASRYRKAAANSDVLSESEERTLNQLILSDIGNGVLVGIALVKETCFSAKVVCGLKWNSVKTIENHPNAVLVSYRMDEIAGATHDYTFPVVGFGVKVLQERRTYLKGKGFSEKQIEEMYIASKADEPKEKLDDKVLTETSRNVLHNAGVGYAVLAGLREYQVGAGIALLQQTYRDRLETACGLIRDKAAVKFLMHRSLNNMLQANHYRAMTDETARYYFLTALERNKRCEDVIKRKRTIARQKIEGGEVITAMPENSKYRSRATFRLRLKPGQMVTVRTAHGCRVEARLKTVNKGKATEEEDIRD